MQYSVAFASEIDSWRWAKRAEELGFHAAWFYDTQLLNPDVFVCMALAAHETDRIRLGTGVLVPSNRIAPVAANALASLNRIAPGRIDFGVGTGFTARRTMGQRALTLAETARYVDTVRTMLRGETAEWSDGERLRKVAFLDPDLGLVNVTDDVPLWFSAFGPRAKRLSAELGAGWVNFGATRTGPAIDEAQAAWRAEGRTEGLEANLFFLGAVLTGDPGVDEGLLMSQAAPLTAVFFHNRAETDPANRPPGALGEATARYLEQYGRYEPADARYLTNHKGHLMYLRPEETHITPDLVRSTTMSGTEDELIERLREVEAQGYTQVTVQLVHGHEHAIEDWARLFDRV